MMDHHSNDDAPSDPAEDVFARNAAALRRRAQDAERRGLVHLERGLYLSAIEELREAVETYRNIKEGARVSSAQQYLALALYERGDIEEAVSMWEELVGQGWTRPTTLNFLVRHYEGIDDADVCISRGRCDDAAHQLIEDDVVDGRAIRFIRYDAGDARSAQSPAVEVLFHRVARAEQSHR